MNDNDNDIGSIVQTTIFHERIIPIREVYQDDPAAFGRIMLGLFDFSIDGIVRDLDDKHENSALKILRNMVDVGRKSTRVFKVNQTIKSNLKYATSVEDMQSRLKRKGLSEEEVQLGVDRYRAKLNRDAGLTEDGQFPADTSWETVDKIRGY